MSTADCGNEVLDQVVCATDDDCLDGERCNPLPAITIPLDFGICEAS
jgi:hypothetical protein